MIEQAFQDGLLADGLLWMEMLKARNEAAHLYDEAVFLRLYDQARRRFLMPLQVLAQNRRIASADLKADIDRIGLSLVT